MEFEEFKYIIDENDKSIERIRKTERFFGFEECNPTNFSCEIKELALEIVRDFDLFKDFEFTKKGHSKKFINKTKAILNELGIEYPQIYMYKPGFDTSLAIHNEQHTLEFLKNVVKGYPTDLPIVFSDGQLKPSARASLFEYFEKNGIVFKDIVLPLVEKDANSVIYAHELTHVAIDEARGGCEYITNRETLPILIELLTADKINKQEFMDKVIRRRLSYLASVIADIHDHKDMNFETRIILESYVSSIIQGLTLFNICKDDDSSKKEIIGDMNKVFKGETLTEDMLERYDADYRKADLRVKTLKRHMSR